MVLLINIEKLKVRSVIEAFMQGTCTDYVSFHMSFEFELMYVKFAGYILIVK